MEIRFNDLLIFICDQYQCYLMYFIPKAPCLFLSSYTCLCFPCSVFGISPIVQSNCSYTWKLILHPERKWYHFVNPIMLLILYYTLATLIRLWLQEPIDQLTVRTADRNAAKAHELRPFLLYSGVTLAV